MSSIVYIDRYISIRSIAVSEMENNVYLLTSRESGAQILIDAADDAPAIRQLLSDGAADITAASATARLDTVITTHQHWDHVRALPDFAVDGVEVLAGADDADALPVPVSGRLEDGDSVEVQDITLDVIHLRGHTPGSVALAYLAAEGPTLIFTGDSLFPGGVGNTQKDPARFAQLFADVSDRIFGCFPDETRILPGHGLGTTLGAERPALPEWSARGW